MFGALGKLGALGKNDRQDKIDLLYELAKTSFRYYINGEKSTVVIYDTIGSLLGPTESSDSTHRLTLDIDDFIISKIFLDSGKTIEEHIYRTHIKMTIDDASFCLHLSRYTNRYKKQILKTVAYNIDNFIKDSYFKIAIRSISAGSDFYKNDIFLYAPDDKNIWQLLEDILKTVHGIDIKDYITIVNIKDHVNFFQKK